MQTITLPNGTELLLVGVAGDAKYCLMLDDGNRFIKYVSRIESTVIKLPPGQWQILGTLSPDLVPDFEVEGLVEKVMIRFSEEDEKEGWNDYLAYWNYLKKDQREHHLKYPKQSFTSLLHHHKIKCSEGEKLVVLIKK